jgi:hypothetical protein
MDRDMRIPAGALLRCRTMAIRTLPGEIVVQCIKKKVSKVLVGSPRHSSRDAPFETHN